MHIEFKSTEKDFGAMEIAKYAGVSQMKQRDWRRHGYLPPAEPGRRARYSILDLCVIALTSIQTEAGKELGAANWIAKMSAGVAKSQIELCPQAVAFEGLELNEDQKRAAMRYAAGLSEADIPTRYLFFPNHWVLPSRLLVNSDEAPATCYHFATLAEMEGRIGQDWISGQIFDLKLFAENLAQMIGEPLIHYHVSGVRT
ncbi:hypothetical protein [Roseinatronobacter sp. NSM]|uniref:hypothetical protein n=1 Tax=Roseinatronobacter sp. NSM TaxID=3457785 RepID=UPI004035A8D5